MPPTVMWGLGKPGIWTEVDVLLIEALQVYEDNLCSGCGQPLAHTSWDKQSGGPGLENIHAFKIGEVNCSACEVLENKNAGDEPKAGVKRYIRNLMSQLKR